MQSPDRFPDREYGKGGLVGIGTPQANPTVEAEFRRLLPGNTELVTTRLRGSTASSGQRMVDYLENLGVSLAAFDTLRPDVFGFANTAASYLLPAGREDEVLEKLACEYGYPIITAAAAVAAALKNIGARKIGIIAPYPAEIVEASVGYWRGRGLAVLHIDRIDIGSDDTRNIYSLRSGDVLPRFEALPDGLDAVLLSGTGMPSLAAIDAGRRQTGLPVLSSNYCLAWALLRSLGDGRDAWSNTGPTLALV